MQILGKQRVALAAQAATAYRQVLLLSATCAKWAHTPPEEHRLQCAPCATLASTAHLQGLDLCLACVKLVHILQAALSPLPASHAPWARSRIPPDSHHARHALPACIAGLWDSSIQLALAEQDRIR